MPTKKRITINVDSEIADEFHLQIKNFVDDFYGDEKEKIIVGELEDAE